MAKQRVSVPVIQLPAVPPEMEPFRAQVQSLLTQLATPGVFRVHEIDMVDALRSGDGLPIGALYVDESNTVKMVAAEHLWAPRKEISLQVGVGGVE